SVDFVEQLTQDCIVIRCCFTYNYFHQNTPSHTVGLDARQSRLTGFASAAGQLGAPLATSFFSILLFHLSRQRRDRLIRRLNAMVIQ
ncbi:hypothetical protein KAR91_17875, partial [Candidatus Pacearchaeota archaeon]|nr:hypothetical protein [Candidatus Pacearchaeota archaeon]